MESVSFSLSAIIQTGIGGVLGLAAKIMLSKINEMAKDVKASTDHLAKINGSIVGMKVWQEQHERQDDERQKHLEKLITGSHHHGQD